MVELAPQQGLARLSQHHSRVWHGGVNQLSDVNQYSIDFWDIFSECGGSCKLERCPSFTLPQKFINTPPPPHMNGIDSLTNFKNSYSTCSNRSHQSTQSKLLLNFGTPSKAPPPLHFSFVSPLKCLSTLGCKLLVFGEEWVLFRLLQVLPPLL